VRKSSFLLFVVLATAGLLLAQNWSSPVDILGAHNNEGRGCSGCHSPHSGSFGAGERGSADTGSYALWGQDASPLYGKTIAFGDNGQYVEVLPNGISSGSSEVTGILLCLSCHDGSLTQRNMMLDWSYEEEIGLLKNRGYGSQKIPTLLGNDGTGAEDYKNDHPVGQNAIIPNLSTYGLVFSNNSFTVTPGSAYDTFITNYGAPDMQIGRTFDNVNGAGQPYLTCRTCHNQHVMTVFKSTADNQIERDGGGKFYATFFFIAAPYNLNLGDVGQHQASPTSQFCRQCHFIDSDEANNSMNVITAF
jgi:hypothetical protein